MAVPLSDPSLLVQFLFSICTLIANFLLADRTSVFQFEPPVHTLVVEPMKTGEDDVFFFDLVLALTDSTLLVFFAEIHTVRFSKL